MKKLIMLMTIAIFITAGAKAQTEIKVKKTTTPSQKVHNTFSKNKKYKGYKVKGKVDGRKVKADVNTQKGTAEIKHD